MRQPLKPFSVETRQTGRRKMRAPAEAAREPFLRLDPDNARTSSYDAALRAADMLFGGGGPAAPRCAPAPDTEASDLDAASPGGSRPQGRILQAIEAPVVEPMVPASLPPARRGRPPGSKNKVARGPVAPRHMSPAEPLQHVDKTADALIASLFGGADPIQAPAMIVAAPTPTPRLTVAGGERVRSSWAKKDLGPGERWKRRLPRVCW